jgi:putative ABC transport system ATP-binding protein
MAFIEGENLIKQYGAGEGAVMAVRGINLHLEKGELIAIMGESGSGKSTLLSILGGLNTPTSGRYRVGDKSIYELSQEGRADFRREFLGFVFQSFHLVPYLTVKENVMLPLAPAAMKGKEKGRLAEEALSRVGLRGMASRLPSQVSGGEQERVAIARAIVNRPPILLADEPTGNLDSKTGREIMELLKQLNHDGMTIVMVTHNPECAHYAGRILRIADGLLSSEERISGPSIFGDGSNGSGVRGDAIAFPLSPSPR